MTARFMMRMRTALVACEQRSATAAVEMVAITDVVVVVVMVVVNQVLVSFDAVLQLSGERCF